MRIGVLTRHWVYNFGANLQALSTYTFLRKMGHDPWVLNYRAQSGEDTYRRLVDPVQADMHESLCNLYLRQSPVCRSDQQLVEFCTEVGFDAILVGSDSVFRLGIDGMKVSHEDSSFPNPYWLKWANSSLEPRPVTAALAASAMGANYFTLPSFARRRLSAAVRNMTRVTVRDRWTQLMLLAVSQGRCRPRLCPDPVVVLNDVFQIPDEHMQEPAAQSREYILLSIYDGMLSDQWVRDFVRLAHDEGLLVFSLPLPERPVDIPVDRVIPLPLSPLTWYAWIQHAAGLIGVHFHPVVCSMVNDVPFLSFDTYATYLRLSSKKAYLRFSSKTYDLCARSNTRSLCLAGRQRLDLSPRKAFQMLRGKEQHHAKRYVAQAKRDFSRIVNSLLVC